MPIRATTVDEVQLLLPLCLCKESMTVRRILLWQIAGSPTLRMPPLFDLPSCIYDRVDDQECLMRLPPDKVVALVAISLSVGDPLVITHLSAVKSVL